MRHIYVKGSCVLEEDFFAVHSSLLSSALGSRKQGELRKYAGGTSEGQLPLLF